ncbi:hypothetical protein BDN71DRAFT_760190 [Pleurotus eryngii]|uniref:Uncharacterized protein n=1 Tax=Pleurotus eryngii TaxID=5323 RepID=A0A9P5ZGC8_PLEER|nr:hypothetical protein BDN71DRAFT_760190 [Pleurotus eryngii]
MLPNHRVVEKGPHRLPYGHEQVTQDFCELQDVRPSGNAKTRIKGKSKSKKNMKSLPVVSSGSEPDIKIIDKPDTSKTTRSISNGKAKEVAVTGGSSEHNVGEGLSRRQGDSMGKFKEGVVVADRDAPVSKGQAKEVAAAGASSKHDTDAPASKGKGKEVAATEGSRKRRGDTAGADEDDEEDEQPLRERKRLRRRVPPKDGHKLDEAKVFARRPTPVKPVKSLVEVVLPLPAKDKGKKKATKKGTKKGASAKLDTGLATSTSKPADATAAAATSSETEAVVATDTSIVTPRPVPRRLQAPTAPALQDEDVQPYEGRPRMERRHNASTSTGVLAVATPAEPVDVVESTSGDNNDQQMASELRRETPPRLTKRTQASPDSAAHRAEMRATKRSRPSNEAPLPAVKPLPLEPRPVAPPIAVAPLPVAPLPVVEPPPVEPPSAAGGSPVKTHKPDSSAAPPAARTPLLPPRTTSPPGARTPLLPSIELVQPSPYARAPSLHSERSHGEFPRERSLREYPRERSFDGREGLYGYGRRERDWDYAYQREREYHRGYLPPPRSAAGSHTGSLTERSDHSFDRGRDEYRDYRDYHGRERQYEYPDGPRTHSRDKAYGSRRPAHLDDPRPPRSRERPDDEPPRPHAHPDKPRIHDYPDEPRRRPRAAFTEDDAYMHELPPVAGTSSRGHHYDRYQRQYPHYPAGYDDFNSREPGFHDPAYYYRDMRMPDLYRRGHLYPPSPPQGLQQLPSRGRSPGGRSPGGQSSCKSPAPGVLPAADS